MDDNLNRSDGLSDTEGQDISATDLEALMKKYMPEYFEDGKEADPGDPPDASTVPPDGDAGQKPSNPYEGFVKEYVIDGKSSEDAPFNIDEDAETPAEGAEDLALSVQMPEEDVPVFNFDDEFIDDVPQNAFAVSDDESPDDPYADEGAFAGGGLFAKLAERRAQRAARKKSRAQDDDGQIPLDEDLVPPQGEPEPEKPLIPDSMVSDAAENAHETAETAEDADFNPFEAEEITPEVRELFSDGEKSDEPAETAEEVQPDDGQPNEDQPDEGGTEDAAAEEQLPEEEVLPEDHDLRVAFGMDENDDGTGRAAEKHPVVNASKTFKLDRPEFVDRSQINDIREEYKKKSRSLWLRLIACAVITVALLIYENIAPLTSIFTGNARQLSGAFDPAVYPTVYAMISLQLMLLACLCAYDQIFKGIKNVFRGTPRPETVTALLTLFGIIYSIVICHAVTPGEEPVMFNSLVAMSALLTLIYAILNLKREMMNFRIVANKRQKHIVRRLSDEEARGEEDLYENTEEECVVMKIEKTDFIDGFFARLEKPDAATGSYMTFVMGISVALAAVLGIFAAVKGETAATVCRVVYMAICALTPMSLFVTFSYPFFKANVAARSYESAIVGETSLEEYSSATVISFDDKNVFPSYSVKVQNIRIYNNARIDRVLYYAASVFAYAGGPLQDVFEVATKDMGMSNDVKIFDAESGFLATQVDGVNITFGSAEALEGRGFIIPDNATSDDVDFSDELSVMYMFRENKLVSKLYIKYVMDSDIDLILKQLSGDGLYVDVRTFDPNIDEQMIARKLNMKRMPLKIIRYANAEEVDSYEEKADSGLVTSGSPKFLLQIISYCGKVLRTRKTNIAIGTLSVIMGVAVLAMLLIAGSLGILNSLFLALYQLAWIVPAVISAKMHIK